MIRLILCAKMRVANVRSSVGKVITEMVIIVITVTQRTQFARNVMEMEIARHASQA